MQKLFSKAILIAWSGFNPHSGQVVTFLDKALYDDYLCVVASNKQQIQWQEMKFVCPRKTSLKQTVCLRSSHYSWKRTKLLKVIIYNPVNEIDHSNFFVNFFWKVPQKYLGTTAVLLLYFSKRTVIFQIKSITVLPRYFSFENTSTAVLCLEKYRVLVP